MKAFDVVVGKRYLVETDYGQLALTVKKIIDPGFLAVNLTGAKFIIYAEQIIKEVK